MPTKPSEKRLRVPSSDVDEEASHSHVGDEDAILQDILHKLQKLDLLEQINERLMKIESETSTFKEKIAQLEKGLNFITGDVNEMKKVTEQKADKVKFEALENEVEELRNRSRRNNLVFYNVPEKAEGQDCAGFIQDFILSHMGLETLCGHVEIERAHRTPTKSSRDPSSKQRPRPIHVSFLRYVDKMKVLYNAAARLKNNPLGGNLIGISEDFAKKTQEQRKALVPFKKHLQKKLSSECKVFIAYPASLKFVDENGNLKIVRKEDFKNLKDEMENEKNELNRVDGASS